MADTSLDSLAAGSGLSGFGGAAPADPGNGGADVPPSSQGPMDLSPPAPQPQTSAPSGQPAPSFGSGLSSFLGGPSYRAPDPQMTALDQTADTLQQRVKRANEIASNPVLQFLNPEGVQKARDFVPAATKQLEEIRTRQASIKAGHQQAETLGLQPGDYTDESTQADRVEVAKARALSGDLKVFKGLQAVDPKAAEAIQDQVHEVAASHVGKAQTAFDKLSSARGQGEYAATLDMLRKDGTLTDLEALGMKVPPNMNAFDAVKAREGQALREARIGVDSIRQKLEERNTYQPMEEKEAKTYNGRMTTAYGDQITNGTWSRNAAAGTRGFVVNGAADPRDLGKNFTLATPEQRKAIKEEFEHAIPKEDLEKYRAFNRTYQLATTDSKGNKLADDKINTNPNVQQGIAEGLASMLRGGSGGANVGLLKIEGSKRAYVQSLLDTIKANYAGGVNTLTGDTVKPYLTNLTQKQVRDVMDALHAYNTESIGNRSEEIAKRAGALGLDAAALGLGKGENAVDDALKAGRDAQIERMMPYHQAIGGGDGVFQLGAQRPGQGATGTPAGTAPTTQLPGAPPVATPVQQASPTGQAGGGPSPSTPTQPASSGDNGGGGQPIQIAGQPVTPPAMPQGASPNFIPALQRIESGNERDPWTSGSKLSSAGGAFQFIKTTWAANKPAGAPDNPRDATPQQQTEALANLTAKNAAALSNARVPVNDTTLYMAHNVGAGGASALLSASPTADARSIVGEAAAKNNPMFFKGRPTVATVLQRYQDAMNAAPDDTGPKPRTPSTGATASQPKTFMQRMVDQAGVAGSATGGLETQTPEQMQQIEKGAEDALPAIGSTVGAVGGSLVGGPAGGVAGGAVGGGAGQSLKDRMQGRAQNPTEIVKQAALGGVLGVASEARPVIAAAARVAGGAGVNAGAEAVKGGDTADVIDKAVEGGGYALGGEALGRFISALGPVAHKVLSNYLPSAQKELSVQAGKLADARKVLETEQPKLPGANGASSPNPKYDAAKATEEKATQYIKDHNQSPDDMVYAYEQAKSGVSAGEALTMRGASNEKSAVSEGYNELRQKVADTGVGAPKPNQAVPDGPVSMLRTAENPAGKVEAKFQPDAEHAEMLIKAPAKDWGQKWSQLQNAGSELIKKRMDFIAAGDKTSAEAMNSLFEGVRNQQKAAAEYVFGKEAGKKVISHLEELDTRYAKVMNATQGMNYEKMRTTLSQGNTPAARELEKNFREFAKDDPSAIRAFNAMKAGAKGDFKSEAALMGPVIAGEVAANLHGIPTVGAITALVGGHRLYKLVQGYMNAKLLGTPVTFKDFLAKEIKANPAGAAAREGLDRGALQAQ